MLNKYTALLFYLEALFNASQNKRLFLFIAQLYWLRGRPLATNMQPLQAGVRLRGSFYARAQCAVSDLRFAYLPMMSSFPR